MRACMIDMDGTLMDSYPYWHRAEQKALAALGVPPEEAYRTRLIAQPDQMVAQTGLDIETLWDRCGEHVDEYYATVIGPKPGALPFLRALREKGMMVWLVTASRSKRLAHAQLALSRAGLLPYLDRTMTTWTLPAHLRKYDPIFYPWLATQMGVDISDLLVVEDQLDTATAAKRAGCTVFGVHEDIHAREAEMRTVCDQYASALDAFLPFL